MTSMIPAPKIACILQIKVQIEPKDRETFLSHFKPVVARVSAEPECAYFIIGEDEPGVFRWTEGWTRDKDWFNNVQLKKDYYEPYFKATEPLFKGERIVEFFTPLDDLSMIKLDLLSFPART